MMYDGDLAMYGDGFEDRVGKSNRELADELCEKLGIDGAKRACRQNMWYGVLEAIEAEQADALSVPPIGIDGSDEPINLH